MADNKGFKDGDALERLMQRKSRPRVNRRDTTLIVSPSDKVPINQGSQASSDVQAVRELPIRQIIRPTWQPRRYFDPDALNNLVTSVREQGIIEPVLVRPATGKSDVFELVAGERRYRAAMVVGLATIPVTVRELTDDAALELAIVENLQREDLNPIEETDGILRLLSARLNQETEELVAFLYRMHNSANSTINPIDFGADEVRLVEQLFDSIGRLSWRSFVTSRLPILSWPEELLEPVRRGQLAYTKAQLISRIKDSAQRQALLEAAITEELSQAAIRKRIAQSKADTQPKASALQNRFQRTVKKLNHSKIWDDPERRERLESLLRTLEQLVEE